MVPRVGAEVCAAAATPAAEALAVREKGAAPKGVRAGAEAPLSGGVVARAEA